MINICLNSRILLIKQDFKKNVKNNSVRYINHTDNPQSVYSVIPTKGERSTKRQSQCRNLFTRDYEADSLWRRANTRSVSFFFILSKLYYVIDVHGEIKVCVLLLRTFLTVVIWLLLPCLGSKLRLTAHTSKALQPGICGRTGSTGQKEETFCVVLRDVN